MHNRKVIINTQRSFGNHTATRKDLCSGTAISTHCRGSTDELFKTNGLALGLQNQQSQAVLLQVLSHAPLPDPARVGHQEER